MLRSWARMEATAAGDGADGNGSSGSAQPSPAARKKIRAVQPSLPDRYLFQVQHLQSRSRAVAMSMMRYSNGVCLKRQSSIPCSPVCGSWMATFPRRAFTAIADPLHPLQGG